MYKSISRLLEQPKASFFLFGPRGVGKSTWVRSQVKPNFEIDLLEHQTFLELQRNPTRIEAMTAPIESGRLVFIDEIQKLPELLDEVHRLTEKRRLKFVMTGSSARKLRRSGVNLLAGRAQTRRMFPFSIKELGDLSTEQLITWGTLPMVVLDQTQAAETLAAYVETYLREEIKEEALVRRVAEFSRFLEIAGQLNGQVLNFENVSRETGKSAPTVQAWYQILEDTLLGYRIPAYRPGFKVRETGHAKFYWFDPGVARAAAGLIRESVDRIWLGTSLETMILNELLVYNEVSRKLRPIYYYGTPGAGEIDFVIELEKRTVQRPGRFLTIEVKLSNRWRREFEAPARALKVVAKERHTRMIGVYTGRESLKFGDYEVYPVREFVDRLFADKIF